MPWYVSTLEAFAVTQVRPAPPARLEARRARRPEPVPTSRPDTERAGTAR